MLEQSLKDQLSQYLTFLKHEIVLVASTNDTSDSQQMLEMLHDIASLSSLVSVDENVSQLRTPSFQITRKDENVGVEFAGLPMGHEFTSLVLALLHVGGHPPKVSEDVVKSISNIKEQYLVEIYFSQSCQNCPDVVQSFNTIAALNKNIRVISIDGSLFPQEVEERNVLAVPSVYVNGQLWGQGRMTMGQILSKLDTAPQSQPAIPQDPFDVLIVGGGPAGASSAIYAARKGLRVGIVCERFGGQVLDTMSIENFISVPYTEGPKLVHELEQHVRQYGVEIIEGSAVHLTSSSNSMKEITLSNNTVLQSKTVVLAPGANWRHINVPGEQEYKNKGVTFCPHCDGPLFKGKRVAVIGGGNSGVEAAIDLAGLVEHVTVIEYDFQLRADQVLQNKLKSLSNTSVVLNAKTTHIIGNGNKVTDVVYEDRANDHIHQLQVNGVFVQIGLSPNTAWLKDALALNHMGEIEINDKGATSMEGVFAAGDATTVPYKQIVVATGSGATAALSAFDYLIRH